jgi:CRISPR-associated protein Cmr3
LFYYFQTMFSHLITIHPLGFLYGSAGPFLSPENLVGRSGNSFPPGAATVSGLYAAQYGEDNQRRLNLPNLRIAGPFWAKSDTPSDFYVPTPFNYLVEGGTTKITYRLRWFRGENQWLPQQQEQWEEYQETLKKWRGRTWRCIKHWNDSDEQQVCSPPWKYDPHLHPRLEEEQRHTKEGELFLENIVQMDPDYCLVYLTNEELPQGWYRFGGEGHLVEVQCHSIEESLKTLFAQPVGQCFALITSGIWGSQRFSHRFPEAWKDNLETWITERPTPFRYRLGGQGKVKRLSHGRYAVPAGTVYLLKEGIPEPWYNWDKDDLEDWFPKEGYSFKRWGCGLALPLNLN